MKPAVWLLGATLVLAGCGKSSSAAPTAAQPAATADAEPAAYTYQIVNIFPHDRGECSPHGGIGTHARVLSRAPSDFDSLFSEKVNP